MAIILIENVFYRLKKLQTFERVGGAFGASYAKSILDVYAYGGFTYTLELIILTHISAIFVPRRFRKTFLINLKNNFS